MTDYTKTTGTNGTMMIRDTGTTVEFWFKAGYASDWVNGLKFSWTANGSTTSKSINYPTGAAWYHVGTVTVSTEQTVTFRLVSDTSISGIGGPTTFSHNIARNTVPAAPSKPVLSGITTTSVYVVFTDGSNGGAAINSRQIAYDTDSSGSSNPYIASDGSTTVTGLDPNTKYYFWARTHNSEGYSKWSASSSATTMDAPNAPAAPLISSVTMTTVDVAFSAPSDNGGSAITGYEIGYSLVLGAPTFTITATSPQVVTGLSPGTTFYFRVRAKNKYGFGPWSNVTVIKTVAGAFVNVGGVWKQAVPYVRVAGVWKIAEPWVRYVGEWKRTTN